MFAVNDTIDHNDPFNLLRFVNAQEQVYGDVLAELRDSHKQTHWMWFVFPQLDGLGRSPRSKYYAIRSKEEAFAYLNHPVLGIRLLECTNIVLNIKNRAALEIFGSPDDWKFKSCMTLFASVATPKSVFDRALERYFQGRRDTKTLELLKI